MKIFITKMQRWGSYSNHSYILGVFKSKPLAQVSGKIEKIHRGGKYEYEIFELETDQVDKVSLTMYFFQEDKYDDKNSIEIATEKEESQGITSTYLLKANKKVLTLEILEDLGLSDPEIMALHQDLDLFTHEEKVYFRNWYLGYLSRGNLRN